MSYPTTVHRALPFHTASPLALAGEERIAGIIPAANHGFAPGVPSNMLDYELPYYLKAQ